MEHLGRDGERELWLLAVNDVHDVATQLSVHSRFVCLLAWDARDAGVEDISIVARALLDAGACYVCTWGADCKRVHDVIDEESVELSLTKGADVFAMTTWHDDEPLSEAILFVLMSAVPEEAHIDDCRATVAIAIGSEQWAAEIRSAFAQPSAFVRDHI